MENSPFGITIALLSTLCWALCAIFLKKLGEKIEPLGMTTIKSIVAAILLFIIAFITGVKLDIESNYLINILLSAILGIIIGDSLFFASLNKLSPLTLSLVLLMGPDVFSAIFGVIFLNEIPSRLAIAAILILLIGISCIIFPIKIKKDETKTKAIGVFYAILSLICSAYSMVLIKPILKNSQTITITMYRMLFSAIILLFFAFCSKKIFVWKKTLNDKKYNIQLISTFILATLGGFWLSLIAFKHCQLVIASSIMTLEPLFILIFMTIFSKYIPSKKEIIGILLILSAIFMIYLC